MDGEVIVVAVDASKEITDYALQWTVHNLIKSQDFLFLLAVHPSGSQPHPSPSRTPQSRTTQFFSNLLKKCRGNNEKSSSGTTKFGNSVEPEVAEKTNIVCEIMMRQLLSAYKLKQVKNEVRVIMDSQLGTVAAAAEKVGATWVVLDRRLKKEGDSCLKQLVCNVVLIDHAIPRILKAVSPQIKNKHNKKNEDAKLPTANVDGQVCKFNRNFQCRSTTQSSFELGSSNARTDTSSSVSTITAKDQLPSVGALINNEDKSTSYFHLNSQYFQKEAKKTPTSAGVQPSHRTPVIHPEAKRRSYSGPVKIKNEIVKNPDLKVLKPLLFPARRSMDFTYLPSSPNESKDLITRKNSLLLYENKTLAVHGPSLERMSSIRRAVSLSIKQPPVPPPLCSVCKHNVPHFGTAPKKFSYNEIERATNGFAPENFLAEGGFGPVYKGVLPEGQMVAVKQHKFLSAQGASEFCSEVEVLSCAQHENLVMLVGYCIKTEWLLVYEFACNGSLDKHLYGNARDVVMSWHNRMKVAKGAPRGLRYLHEDCRVGSIIHRDFRPNNILLTHDFEPMVGDFGLARCQADGESAEETYLAPEYTQTGLVTEKADVYAYGIVLLELMSGFKAVEFSKTTGKQFVSDWGLPLLKRRMINELIDPRLSTNYDKREVELMMCTAELCLSSLPEERPRMSQVLKILDGNMPNSTSSRSGQHTSHYPGKEMGNFATSWSMHHEKYGSSVITEPHENGQEAKCWSTLKSNHDKAEGNYDACNSAEMLVSEEFQASLHGSLAKFMSSMSSQGNPQLTHKTG